MKAEKIDLMEWQKKNLSDEEKGEIYGVPENSKDKFKGVDEDGSEVDIPDKLEKDEKTEELFLKKIAKDKDKDKTVKDDNKEEKNDNGSKNKQFQIGKRGLAKLKRKQEKGIEEDKKVASVEMSKDKEPEINLGEFENDMYKQLYNKLEEEYNKANDQELCIKNLTKNLEEFTAGKKKIDKEDEEFIKEFISNEKNEETILELYKKVALRVLNEIKNDKTREDKKINLGNNREEAIEKIVINGKDLEEQRQEIMEKLKKLGDEGYIDKDKQEKLEKELEEVETLMKKTGDKVKEKLVVLSKKEIAQEEVKVENYKADRISDLIGKMRERIALLKEQLEQAEDEDKKRMVKNEMKVAEGKLKIYENKFNKLGKDLIKEEISEEIGEDTKEIRGGVEGSINYELSNEQFDKIKLFLGESGEGRWREALLVLSTFIEKDFGLPGYFDKSNKGFNVEKENDNLANVYIFTDEKRFKIKIEFDPDKKSINVNVTEKILETPETPEKPETSEVPETLETEQEQEKGPRTIRDLVVILGKLEEYEMFRRILSEKETRKAEMKKEINRKEKAGEEVNEEENETYRKISKEVKMAVIDVTESEIEALYEYEVKNGDEETEDWILKRRVEAQSLLMMQYEVLGRMGDIEDKNIERLSKAKRKATNRLVGGIVKRIPKWFTGESNDQQTGEAKKVGRWRGLQNYIEEKVFGNSTEENEGDEKEFDKSEFKEAVVAKFLDMQNIAGEEEQNKFPQFVGEKKIGVPKGKQQEEIARSLLDEYGDGKELEDLIEIIGEFKFTKEDFEKAIERKKTDKIPEVKGFREVVEDIENKEREDLNYDDYEIVVEPSGKLVLWNRKDGKPPVEKGKLVKHSVPDRNNVIKKLLEQKKEIDILDVIFSKDEISKIKNVQNVESLKEIVGDHLFKFDFHKDSNIATKYYHGFLLGLSNILSNYYESDKKKIDSDKLHKLSTGLLVIDKDKGYNENANNYFATILEKIGEFVDTETGRGEGYKTEKGEVTEEMREEIRKGLVEEKKGDKNIFNSLGEFMDNFSKEKRLFGDVFTKEWFDAFKKDMGIDYEDIKGIETRKFMAVFREIYEEVKGEKENVESKTLQELFNENVEIGKNLFEEFEKAKSYEELRKVIEDGKSKLITTIDTHMMQGTYDMYLNELERNKKKSREKSDIEKIKENYIKNMGWDRKSEENNIGTFFDKLIELNEERDSKEDVEKELDAIMEGKNPYSSSSEWGSEEKRNELGQKILSKIFSEDEINKVKNTKNDEDLIKIIKERESYLGKYLGWSGISLYYYEHLNALIDDYDSSEKKISLDKLLKLDFGSPSDKDSNKNADNYFVAVLEKLGAKRKKQKSRER